MSKSEGENLNDYVKIMDLNLRINYASAKHSDELENFVRENSPKYDSLNVAKFNSEMPSYLLKLKNYLSILNPNLENIIDSLSNEKRVIYKLIMERKVAIVNKK